MKQIKRDTVIGDLSLEYFAKWMSAGWKVGSIEWVREVDKEQPAADEATGLISAPASIPYGLHIAGSGSVEENPVEANVLLRILEQIVQEKGIQEIAVALNRLGYVTREGYQWSASAVFNLLPRLIEVGPELLKSAAWQQKRAETIN